MGSDDTDVLPPPEFYEEMAKDCRCCPVCEQVPCDTVCAGGVCLSWCRCSWDEDFFPDDFDEEDATDGE